ncbi:MAG: 3-phosphoshikimate 1-carboxyvinyltransferase [Ruminococcaceae bacterium]|nr:3-phosphoshikimate 1-carboxyvinyltransferase [Oscillospiraceae bacterium]
MNVTLIPSSPKGEVRAIASKSAAHRLLICAAFANAPTKIRCEQLNRDIEATADCLSALGATIDYKYGFFTVKPIKDIPKEAKLHCGESGSTLRFLVPIVAALGVKTEFVLKGRLPERPLSPLRELLEENGIKLSVQGSNPLICEGKLNGNEFSISGSVSSQFISGLLFALALCKNGGSLTVTDKLESAPYVSLTCDALKKFGANITKKGSVFTVIPTKLLDKKKTFNVEGDWSNAAFPLCAAAIDGDVTVTNINLTSRQGDKKIVELLLQFGADVETGRGRVRVRHAPLKAIDIDASHIPDLVPVLAAVASVAEGTTRIYGAARLRIKESDRLLTVCNMLNSLGADVTQTEDGLIINGKASLIGGTVDSANDHRITMSAAVASVACDSPVTILGAEACQKSYPAFFEDMEKLGFKKK